MQNIVYKVLGGTEVVAVKPKSKKVARVFGDINKPGRFWFVIRKAGESWDWTYTDDPAVLEKKMRAFEENPTEWKERDD